MLLKLILAFLQSFHNPSTPFFVEDFEVLLIILVVPTLEFWKKLMKFLLSLKVKLFMLVVIFLSTWYCLKFVDVDDACPMTHSQLLAKFKSESKYKIAEGGGVRARSLAHNTLRGKGACWSFEMGLGKVDKLHSLTQAYTQPTQGD